MWLALRLAGWVVVLAGVVLAGKWPIGASPNNPGAALELYTLLLAAFTCALTAATVELWIAARNQSKDGRLNNRAYIAVEPSGLAPWRGEADKFLGHVRIANAGVLPARALTWLLEIEMTDDGDRKEFPLSDTRRGHQLVVGRSEMARGTRPTTRMDKSYCFVWGIVEYDDGFGKRRHTKFCHRYNCRTNTFKDEQVVAAEDARQHEFGNDAN